MARLKFKQNLTLLLEESLLLLPKKKTSHLRRYMSSSILQATLLGNSAEIALWNK